MHCGKILQQEFRKFAVISADFVLIRLFFELSEVTR
jgi:hypothetical protein